MPWGQFTRVGVNGHSFGPAAAALGLSLAAPILSAHASQPAHCHQLIPSAVRDLPPLLSPPIARASIAHRILWQRRLMDAASFSHTAIARLGLTTACGIAHPAQAQLGSLSGHTDDALDSSWHSDGSTSF